MALKLVMVLALFAFAIGGKLPQPPPEPRVEELREVPWKVKRQQLRGILLVQIKSNFLELETSKKLIFIRQLKLSCLRFKKLPNMAMLKPLWDFSLTA